MALPIQIKQVSGKEIEPYVKDLAKLRIEVFREWPYLYEGDFQYEEKYLKTYCKNPSAFVALAILNQEVIGAATAIALQDAEQAFRSPLEKNGYHLADWVYFGESVLKSEYRGHGLGHRFFDERENWARKLNAKGCCFCAVIREAAHPLRPAHARDLKPFWESRGYNQQDHLKVVYRWQDIDQKQENDKTMSVWTKLLR